MPQSHRSQAGKAPGKPGGRSAGKAGVSTSSPAGKLRRGRKTADRKNKPYVDPRLHQDAPKAAKPGERSFTRPARPGSKPYGSTAKREDGGFKKSYDKPYSKSSEQKEGGETKVHVQGKPKKPAGKKGNYGYMRTLAESSTGAKGGSFKRKHTISPGKKKVLLKKRSAEIKFQKKRGKISFDLKRLTLGSFEDAGLPEVVSPVEKFTDFALAGPLQKNIAKKGLVNPTPIQGLTIPEILKGRDVIGIANTGTGKTAAFVLPSLQKIITNKEARMIIMAPTRELAEQIDREIKILSEGLDIRTALCIGGRFLEEQARKLGKSPQIVIGTPGRLLDLERRRKIVFKSFNIVVLDEMDRMLDMGFLKDIKFILSTMPRERQTLLFSATMPKLIQELARQFLMNPLEFTVKPRATSKNIEQSMIKIKKGESKIEKLHELLLDPELYKTIIFGRTKRGVDQLVRELMSRGFGADALHGDKTQSARSRALKRFTRDEVTILVATDVAARGLDIPDVTHVINFDIPETYDDYVHRIGRTGRGDKAGKAFTFVMPEEM
jgi:late competence protein required for DNA uptake (superfamily II DNA/RNA helicase)